MERTLDFLVDRGDLRRTLLATGPAVTDLALGDGEALLAVDRFAFTANNISYAAMGERLSYWRVFPAPEPWGRVPVWGYATVERSRAEGVEPGARAYGLYPMSTHVVLAPKRVGPGGFVDGAVNRGGLAALYNRYLWASRDPAEAGAREAEQMLLRPQLATAFLLDDLLAENRFFGARAVIVSSASSKVALGLAVLLARRDAVESWGLTSPRNAAFAEGLGVYCRVVPYSEVDRLPTDTPAVYIDMAGDAAVRRAVHTRLARLAASIVVGETHWEGTAAAGALPGPTPSFFFAPEHLVRRSLAWGPGGVRERLEESWQAFIVRARGWMHIVEERGSEAVARVYLDTLAGRTRPDVGHVLSLRPA